jgi:hypothetical protein
VNGIRQPALISVLAGGLLVTLPAASAPSALARVEPGLWEISRTGAAPIRQCVTNPAALVQYEHRNATCTRVVIRDGGSTATIHYTCTGGGFGHSTMTVLTPRSLRIETQGISDSAPFKYVLQARRMGNCARH